MIEAENKTVQGRAVKSRRLNKEIGAGKGHVVILVLILAICCLNAAYRLTNSVSATIGINSVFSADGQNPDGTPFSIMELFGDDVIDRAVEKLGGKVTAQELRSHLSISDHMNSSSFSRLKQSIFDGENENTYFPTEYLLTYSTISEQIQNEGIAAQCKALVRSSSLPAKSEMLGAVLESYQEYYAEKYLNYDSLFEIDWLAVDSMDYYNRSEFMNDTIQRLMRFLQYKNTGAVSQIEGGGNGGYSDLMVELSKGPAQGVENYQAYVTQNGVTNNKEDLLRQFLYMEKLSQEENTRKMQEYTVLREAIELYDSTTTKVVFIPALDENQEFYMNRTNVGLDYLSEKADNAQLQAASATYSAKQYAYLQTCFGEEYVIDENGSGKQIKNTSEQRMHADELYETLKKDIQRLIAEAAHLTEEGKQTNQEALNVSEPFGSVSIVGAGLSSAKRFVLLLMVAYVVLYTASVLSEKKQKGCRAVK